MEIRESVPLIALDVARAFIDENGSDEPDSIIGTAMMIGEHLAACGAAGRWESFDAASFFPRVGGDAHTRLGVAIQTMALFQWLGLVDLIDIDRAAMISDAIRCHGPQSPILDDFNAAYRTHLDLLR